MKNYEELTGYVELNELDQVPDEFGGTGTPCLGLSIAGFTVKLATAAVCETGACTGYCK